VVRLKGVVARCGGLRVRLVCAGDVADLGSAQRVQELRIKSSLEARLSAGSQVVRKERDGWSAPGEIGRREAVRALSLQRVKYVVTGAPEKFQQTGL
jgi:hypothetical protein